MSCERVQAELIVYHFGMIEKGLRHQLEDHLECCTECLRSYLALKRNIELAESGPEPSPEVLDRLRVSVVRELTLPQLRRWEWWERPFAFGIAGLVVLSAMGAVTAFARAPGKAPHGLVAAHLASSSVTR
jgi:hypothetical protein